ncbi:MAG: integrase core domain-containing protein [Verrucomicrobiota bacterium]
MDSTPLAGRLPGSRKKPAEAFTENIKWMAHTFGKERVGFEPLRLSACSPNLNAYAERFARTIRQECLGRMVCFGESSLRAAVNELVTHYNQERNHQGLAKQLIRPKASPSP